MENNNPQVKIATFQNHYGAMLLKKALGDKCSLRAVPRSLSSSCGTCAFTENCSLQEILDNSDSELLEGIFEKNGEKYNQIYG